MWSLGGYLVPAGTVLVTPGLRHSCLIMYRQQWTFWTSEIFRFDSRSFSSFESFIHQFKKKIFKKKKKIWKPFFWKCHLGILIKKCKVSDRRRGGGKCLSGCLSVYDEYCNNCYCNHNDSAHCNNSCCSDGLFCLKHLQRATKHL